MVRPLSAFTLEPRYTQSGNVFVFGQNDCGQLGIGETEDNVRKPRMIKEDGFDELDVVAVFAGGMHCIALTQDGQLWSWGCNDEKALGRDGEEDRPALVQGLDNEFIVQVACADSATAALTREGR